jgi:4-oxalomesaconate tautomerase
VQTLPAVHPAGEMTCVLTLDADGRVTAAALLRTARKLMDGRVYA